MRSRLLTSLFGLLVFACSAPERANPTPRCKDTSDCSEGHFCYREFCIPFDDPDVKVNDAAVAEPPAVSDAASEPPPELDGSSPTAPSDAEAKPSSDAQAKPSSDANSPPPSPADGGQSIDPGPVSDSAVAPIADASLPVEDASVPPDPPNDAGNLPVQDAAVVDASGVNVQLELTLCLAVCSNAQQLCMTCFRQLVNKNPEICAATGSSATDVLVRTLCQAYCRMPRCEAP